VLGGVLVVAALSGVAGALILLDRCVRVRA